MKVQEVIEFLKEKGTEQTRKTFRNHGLKGDFDGVKVGDLKILQKQIKKDQELALQLFATNHADAQYLAGLIAVPSEFSKEQLEDWAENATWYMVREYAVAWNLADREDCIGICLDWIKSDSKNLQITAWAALAGHIGVASNDKIDLNVINTLLVKVENEIHDSPNRVKYCMNNFVIAVGGGIPDLTEKCINLGERIGKVDVFMGNTSCKVPSIPAYIAKMEERGRIGKKKKTAKC